jgi:hypothetical protein
VLKYKKVTRVCWKCKNAINPECWYCKGTGKTTSKLQVMRCFGGPKSGDNLTQEEAGNDYIRYNPSNNCSGKNRWPCVLVHLDVLEAGL